MPDWSALRRRAREYHRQVSRHLPPTVGPLPTAAEFLAAAEEETGVFALPLAPGDPLLAGAHAVLDRATPCIWYAEQSGAASHFQNFARAHEFGHYWLHPELELDACAVADGPGGIATGNEGAEGTQTEVGYSPVERREKEADLCAAELLLPASALRHAFLTRGLRATQIARYVGVPESCALSQLASALLLPEREEQTTAEENPKSPHALLLLDDSQREAAMIAQGPVLIDAGPGTGKTRTLVARLAHLLQDREVAPENILALTFSNLAAEEMRTRLRQAVGAVADRVWIGTFHAFGLELLRKDGHRIGLPHAPALLETVDAVALLQQHLDRLPLQEFEYLSAPILPFPDILQCISRAKDELKTPADYRALAAREMKAAGEDEERLRAARKSQEVAAIYAVYQRLLKEQGLVDFGDLLMRAVELLDTCPDVQERWQTQFQHILADEYQDINRASAQLLRRLAGAGTGFWAVGDLRQAIYRFRGASSANVRDFHHDFPAGRRLQLRHNYRSQPDLVALFSAFARRMDREEEGRGKREEGSEERSIQNPAVGAIWEARREVGDGPTITVAVAEDEEAQAEGLATSIRFYRSGGVALREQAILCHTNRQTADLAMRLEQRGIPTQFLGSLLEREESKDLLALLSLACESDGAALARVARFAAYEVPPEDVQRLLHAAREAQRLFPAALALAEELPELTEEGRKGLARLHADLRPIQFRGDAWYLLSRYLFDTSDYLLPLLADPGPDGAKRRLAIYQLLQTAQGLARRFQREEENTQTAFLAYLRLLLACGQERSIRPPAEVSEIDGVRLMTIHQSKGLEFPVVYLPNLVEGQFPPKRGTRMAAPPPELVQGTEAENEGEGASEECLFFVALSRARDQLVLSRPATWRKRPVRPCEVLAALEPFLGAEEVSTVYWAGMNSPLPEPAVNTVGGEGVITVAGEGGEVAPFPEQTAPTYTLSALEQYQRCPRQFYYQRVARLPQRDGESAYLAFHQSMAETLSWLQAERNAGGVPDAAGIEAQFATYYDRRGPCTETGLGRLLRRRAGDMLRQAQSAMTPSQPSQPSQPRQMLTAELEHGRVQLTCDQIEELEDGTVRLTDYTTQRPQADDHTAPRLALLRHAARQQHGERKIQVILGNLRTGEQKEIKEAARWEPGRVDKYNVALRSIRAGSFPAEPEPRKCALCPFFLICPA